MKWKYSWILFIMILPACNLLQDHRSNARRVEDGESFELRISETATLQDGTQITFRQLKSDSRCPLRVLCIWEGEIDALFSIESESRIHTLAYKGFVGPTGETSLEQVFGSYAILLEQMDPYPGEGDAEITATLRARRVRFDAQ